MDDIVEDSSLDTTALQQSKEILRECKPSENISINSSPTIIEKEKQKPDPIIVTKNPDNTETVFEKLEINDKSNSSSDSAVIEEIIDSTKTVEDKKPQPPTEATSSDVKAGRTTDRNKSDIFSLDDKIKTADTIFSVNGTPSGRINRRRDEHSEVFPVGCMGCKESKDDSSVNQQQISLTTKANNESDSPPVSGRLSNTHRNPLTGAGVDSTDEMKKTATGRRKGSFCLICFEICRRV